MKIGIYFTAEKKHGGVYQFAISFLEALEKIKANNYLIITTSGDLPEKFYNLTNFEIINTSSVTKIQTPLDSGQGLINFQQLILKTTGKFYKWKLYKLINLLNYLINRRVVNIIRKQKLDLIFYFSASHLATLIDVPFVTVIYDLQHRLNPQFKEVSADGRWETREYGVNYACKYAFRLFVDSAIGKEDIQKYYKVESKRIVVLPFLSPSYLRTNISSKKTILTIKKLHLPSDYIFYPAKFWPHKNHKNLIKALSILKKHGKIVNLVLTGSKDADFSSFDSIMKLVKKYSLDDQVIYLGLVNNEELSVIYKFAKALVMPTYFGPTNIPVLEAWAMAVPVIYSDIRGCREQLGDAGLLVNPNDPNSIAEKILCIYTEHELRLKLTTKGKQKLGKWTFRDFSKRIKEAIDDYAKERSG